MSKNRMGQGEFPDGLADPHLRGPASIRRHASPLALLLLSAILASALGGAFGGGAPPSLATADASEADLVVTAPHILRNGEFFEVTVHMAPKADAEDLTLALDATLLVDLTQNSMMPAAADESFRNGAYEFGYGAVAAGEALDVKMDFQINPSLLGGTKGDVTVLDGNRELARVPVEIEVRP